MFIRSITDAKKDVTSDGPRVQAAAADLAERQGKMIKMFIYM